MESRSYAQGHRSLDAVLGGMGLLAMNMLYLSTFATLTLLKEKEKRTFYRVMVTPLSLKSYMLQNIMSFLVLLLLQVMGMLLTIRYLFNIYLGPSVLNLFIVMAVFALVCVSMGVALPSLVRNTRQAGTVASLIILPFSMLGGLFWPRELMPSILQSVGQLLPTAWIMDAVRIVVRGNPLSSATMELSILLGYAVVFFLLGGWRKADATV